MALPASGQIDFGQIQTEFGGSNPIAMNEYGDKIGLTVGTTSAHDIADFYGLSNINTSFTVKSGYIHGTVTTSGGRRGTSTRYCFNEGYNGFTDNTNGLSDPPSGAITNGTNVGISSGIIADGTVLVMAHKSGGANGLHRVVFRISASSDSNSGFTQLAFANSTLSTSNTLQRSAANYTYASGYRQWMWAQAASTSWTYLTNTQSGHSSKIFGDASSGTGTDSGFSVTVTLT